MATYAFKALDLSGSPTKGEMEAGDKQAVAAQLRSKGLIVVDIEELVPASAGDLMARFQRVKADDLVIATRQLSTMVNSGMSLLRSLYVIEEQTENDKLRDIWIEVRKDVEAGLALVAFLVPVFEKIFKDFGGELPAITKFTVLLSHLVTKRWYVMFAVAFGVV